MPKLVKMDSGRFETDDLNTSFIQGSKKNCVPLLKMFFLPKDDHRGRNLYLNKTK
ncbi:hypothetical protein O3M35_008161 [Rhynocoris fuscipes]|uniref:Uncharacterized protein n=1 Tax=Rhynocoris fuscipes TaxID=488301 RepID=A0AAW1D7M4_9HEMI